MTKSVINVIRHINILKEEKIIILVSVGKNVIKEFNVYLD